MLVGLVLGGIIGYGALRRGNATPHDTERDTITYVDTIAYYQPMAKDSASVRYITRVLPVVRRDTIMAYAERGHARDNEENTPPQYSSDERDSTVVEIPIMQKHYEGEDYTAWVSGYQPNLDSIFVFPRTTIIREAVKKPPDKWHIGITGGYGYGIKSRQAEPFIGIGITYSLFSF